MYTLSEVSALPCPSCFPLVNFHTLVKRRVILCEWTQRKAKDVW